MAQLIITVRQNPGNLIPESVLFEERLKSRYLDTTDT